MLSGLPLPAGARRLPSAPVPASLHSPYLWGGAADRLDLHQVYELRPPMDAVAAVLTARVPTGMSRAGTGERIGPSDLTSREISYTPRSVPAASIWRSLFLPWYQLGLAGRWCGLMPR